MSVFRCLILMAILLCPPPSSAQTTATERAAARDILRQIDELEARLDPTGLARELASRTDGTRDAVVRRTTELWESEIRCPLRIS